jgi:two-component system KDP operon response regulator KdpE
VLVIEDDTAIRRFLRTSLDPTEFSVSEAEFGKAGVRAAAEERPDVVLLDLGLPDIDGIEVVKALRAWSQVPVIVLSARGQEQDKVAALDAGADDYLTKPFSLAELLARIRVARRHARPLSGEPVVETPAFQVDLAERRVTRHGAEVHLTPNEYGLLACLARYAGKVVTQRQLLAEVWGEAYVSETHYLRIYLGQLRHKLEDDPAQPQVLLTEPGVGYRLQTE